MMRRLPLGLVFVAAVLTRRSEEEAAELFRIALDGGSNEPEPLPAPARRMRGEHARGRPAAQRRR